MSYWAVAQCEPRMVTFAQARGDTLAEQSFARIGCETYLPQIRQRHNGRHKIVPLFPGGYVFVRVVAQWYSIRWATGVVRLLMDGEKPARLDDTIVTAIRRREVGGYVKLPPPPPKNSPIKIGENVRILSGSFTGHIGLYQGQSAHEREQVLLDLLGRKVQVTLAPTDRVQVLPVLPDVASCGKVG